MRRRVCSQRAADHRPDQKRGLGLVPISRVALVSPFSVVAKALSPRGSRAGCIARIAPWLRQATVLKPVTPALKIPLLRCAHVPIAVTSGARAAVSIRALVIALVGRIFEPLFVIFLMRNEAIRLPARQFAGARCPPPIRVAGSCPRDGTLAAAAPAGASAGGSFPSVAL